MDVFDLFAKLGLDSSVRLKRIPVLSGHANPALQLVEAIVVAIFVLSRWIRRSADTGRVQARSSPHHVVAPEAIGRIECIGGTAREIQEIAWEAIDTGASRQRDSSCSHPSYA